MTLYRWIRDYIKKYSFIKDVKFKNATMHIFYEHDGETKSKRLPYRATKHQLQDRIDKIKKEINYYEERRQRIEAGQYKVNKDRPMIVYTNEKKKEEQVR